MSFLHQFQCCPPECYWPYGLESYIPEKEMLVFSGCGFDPSTGLLSAYAYLWAGLSEACKGNFVRITKCVPAFESNCHAIQQDQSLHSDFEHTETSC